MKVEFEIPAEFTGQNLYLTTGKELIAYKEYGRVKVNGEAVEGYGATKTKTERCNGCGECCDADCEFLAENGCKMKYGIPIGCLISDCSRHGQYPSCTEKFE